MAILPVHCSVLGAQVMRITDLEGQTVKIVCPEYEDPAGTCRRMKQGLAGGPLSQLLERASEGTLQTRDLHCIIR